MGALSTGAREEQQALVHALVPKQELVNKMMQSRQGHYVAKLAFQLSKACGCVGTSKGSKSMEKEKITVTVTPPALSNPTESTLARPRRRGSGGGAAAQAQAEAHDVLESLKAACRRRQLVRINKAIERAR